MHSFKNITRIICILCGAIFGSYTVGLAVTPTSNCTLLGKRVVKTNKSYPSFSTVAISASDVVALREYDNGTYYVERFSGDSLLVLWSKKLPQIDGEQWSDYQLLWKNNSITVIAYAQYADKDSVGYFSIAINPATGAMQPRTALMHDAKKIKGMKFGDYFSRLSKDSSKLLIARYNYTPIMEEDKPLSKIEARVFDVATMNRIAEGSLDLPLYKDMDDDIEDIHKSLAAIEIAASGEIYQLRFSKTDSIDMIRWNPASGMSQILSVAFPGFDITDNELCFGEPYLLVSADKAVFSAGRHGDDKVKVRGFCCVHFDFKSNATTQWEYDPTKAELEALYHYDEMGPFIVKDIFLTEDGTTILMAEYNMNTAYSSGWMSKGTFSSHDVSVCNGVILAAFDQKGKRLWTSFLNKNTTGSYSNGFRDKKIGNKIVFSYIDHDANGMYLRSLDYKSGTLSEATKLMKLGSGEYCLFKSAQWLDDHSIVLPINTGTGDEDVYYQKMVVSYQ